MSNAYRPAHRAPYLSRAMSRITGNHLVAAFYGIMFTALPIMSALEGRLDSVRVNIVLATYLLWAAALGCAWIALSIQSRQQSRPLWKFAAYYAVFAIAYTVLTLTT